MKKALLTMLCVASFSLTIKAQITINRADYAVSSTVLDSAYYKWMTKTGAVSPTLGNNQTWDYTGLKDSVPVYYKYYRTPAASFGAIPAIFADATHAFNSTALFQNFPLPFRIYEKLDDAGHGQLGYVSLGAKFSNSSTMIGQ